MAPQWCQCWGLYQGKLWYLPPFVWFCRLVPFGHICQLRPALLCSGIVITLHGHVPVEAWAWEMPHVLCVCSAALAFCSTGILEESDGSLCLTEQIPSGHSGLVQHWAAVWDHSPQLCALGELLGWKCNPSTLEMPHESVLQAVVELPGTAAGEEHLPGVSTSSVSRSWRLDSV